MPRRPRIASEITIREICPEECLRAYRTVRVGNASDPELSLSFRSHYEEGKPPRYRQTQHAALHMAVSFWRDREAAVAMALKFPKHGTYLAEVVLMYGHGFNCLDEGAENNPKHLTVWGSAERLAQAVVAIVLIER